MFSWPSSTKLLNTCGEAQSVFSICWRNGDWRAQHSRETGRKGSGIMWSDCPGDQRGWTSLLCPCLSFLSVNVFVFICTLLTLNMSSHWVETWPGSHDGAGGLGFMASSCVSRGLCVRSVVIWGKADVFQGCFCSHSSSLYCDVCWCELSSLLPF